MAKYSVNSTEIITDSGTIDWSHIANVASLIIGVTTSVGTITNCGSILSAWNRKVESANSTHLRLRGDYTFNNNCSNCACDCGGD